MNSIKVIILGIVICGSVLSSVTWAADTSVIEERLQSLEQEIAALRQQLAVQKAEDAKKSSSAVIVTANVKEGFSIKNADESFKLKIRGIVMADARFFMESRKDLGVNDTFTIRRARLIFQGTVSKYFDFYILPDFANGSATLVDAYGEFNYSSQIKIRGGKFKVPMGLERLRADGTNNFMELGLTSNLVPNREVGFQLSGEVLDQTTQYSIGVFNGSADLASSTGQDRDNNNDKDVIARVFVHPFKKSGLEFLKGLGLGLATSYGHNESNTVPIYKSAGQASIFSYASGVTADGLHSRIAPQMYFYQGSFGIIGEYMQSHQKVVRTSGSNIIRDTFDNRAWQISGNYVLTGEQATFAGVVPREAFDLARGTWGAVDVVARYQHLAIDNSIFDNGFASLATAVSGADAWAVGLNWYLDKNIRVSLDFEQTVFDRGAATGDRKTEDLVSTRFQVAY